MKKQIAACIKQMSGKYAPQVVFADWIQCVALYPISNSVQIFHDNLWKQREEQYLATMNRYGKEERMKMAEMAGMLILTYEKGLGDVLGEVYMESIGGNKNSGQFFTPYSVSLATARLTLPDTIDENKKLSLCEPTCGSGGMVIAAAQVLQEKGINYQRVLDVVCQDLDWTADTRRENLLQSAEDYLHLGGTRSKNASWILGNLPWIPRSWEEMQKSWAIIKGEKSK